MVHSLHSLLVSCQQGDRTKVDSILQSGEVGVNSADEGEISPLHVAAANGYEDVVSLLLSRGANVDQRTGSGWTALHQAAYHGHTNVAEVKVSLSHPNKLYLLFQALIKAGAELTKRNKYGATALNMSAAGGHLSCVKLLLRSGCPAEETAPAQYRVCPSAVMTAALHGHNAVIKDQILS